MDEHKLKFLRKKFLNKKVRIEADKGLFVGDLQYIGPNEVLGWPLQITIDRLPVQINKIKSIKLYDDYLADELTQMLKRHGYMF